VRVSALQLPPHDKLLVSKYEEMRRDLLASPKPYLPHASRKLALSDMKDENPVVRKGRAPERLLWDRRDRRDEDAI